MKAVWISVLILCGVTAGWAAEHAPPGHVDSLLPLAVGNSWTWHTNYGDMTEKVARTERVQASTGTPTDCFVVETTAEAPDKIVQTEYYSVSNGELQVVKRSYPGQECVMAPPEVLMREPVVAGEHWEWQGDSGLGPEHLDFRVVGADRLKVPALKQTLICQRIRMQAQSDGSTMSVTRWYAPGIGMVKEDSVMTRGTQSIVVNGVLKAYHLVP